jgi:hypothetical protein
MHNHKTIVRPITYTDDASLIAEFKRLQRDVNAVVAVLEGTPRQVVADQAGVGVCRIGELLVWAGFRETNPEHAERNAAICTALDNGADPAALALEHGIGEHQIQWIREKRGCRPLPKR